MAQAWRLCWSHTIPTDEILFKFHEQNRHVLYSPRARISKDENNFLSKANLLNTRLAYSWILSEIGKAQCFINT